MMKIVPSSAPPSVKAITTGAGTSRAKHSSTSGLYMKKGPQQTQDTIEGCRDNARFDSREAARMGTANARSKYELSAASWTARGDMLQRLETSRAARRSAAGSLKLAE